MPVSANGSASGRISLGPLAVDEAVADPWVLAVIATLL